MKLLELLATLVLDTSGFEDGVAEAAQSAKKLGNNVESSVTSKAVAMGNAMYDAATMAATALWNLGKDAVTAAADIEAENAQFSATFNGMENDAHDAFAGIASDTNILAGRLQAVGIKAFSQFKGSGMDANYALEKMDEYIRLAADAAAYYDITLEDADERMRSFLRGNTEAGDSIGLFTSALQRDDKAMEVYGLKWEKLSELQRQIVMLDIAKEIYTQSGALDQAAREGDAYSNVVANFQRAWQEALATLGGPLLQKITPAIEKLTDFLQENPEIIEKIGEVFGELAGIAVDSLIGGLEWLSENGETVLAVFQGILNVINNVIALLSGSYTTNITTEADIVLDVTSQVSAETGSNILGAIAGGATQSSMSSDSIAGDAGQEIGTWIGNSLKAIFGYATGLDYVPYDEFPARLHEGEAVLTKAEATEWRKNGLGGSVSAGIDYTLLSETLVAALSGVSINMGRKQVGTLVSPTVSKEINRQAKARRYGG